MKTLHDSSGTPRTRIGFTLIEMLLAIGILGIGVISIAALFPVGLTQQRRSVDAIVGPTIANNAYALLRSKLSPNDFGYLNLDSSAPDDPAQLVTIQGDFVWRRPAFIFTDTNVSNGVGNTVPVSAGSINIFEDGDTNTELPFNAVKYGTTAPTIIITQEERYYPQQSLISLDNGDAFPQPPQYVWDCMFRRFQGRIQVAIFVYRATGLAGDSRPYVVADAPVPHTNLLDGSGAAPDDPWELDMNGDGIAGAADDNVIPGTAPGVNTFDPSDYDQGWQTPNQWILDQNNNVYRILSGKDSNRGGPVELARPVSYPPSDQNGNPVRVYSVASTNPAIPVQAIWYVPPIDQNGWQLTPVYVSVRDFE